MGGRSWRWAAMGCGRRRQWIGAAAFVAVAAATAPLTAEVAAAAPTAITVTTTVDVLDDGDGLTSLREAVALANATPGDTEIVLAHATYALSICGPGGAGPAANDAGDLNLARADALGPAVTIAGNGATVVQTCTGVAHLHDDRTTAGSSLTITDATFTGATDVLARGVSIETAATLTLDGVTIANNSAAPPWHWDSDDPGPAAVVATGGPALTVTSSTVTGTVFGGGILDHAPSGSLTVQDAMITGNTGIGTAGGIAALGRHLTIADTTVADNHPPEVQVPDGPVTTFDRLELDEDDLARAGGVYAPSVTAERVRIERNAGYDTGGIEASAIALTDAHIRHNVGTITGGVTAGPGSSVVRATIEENIGELVGGGLRADTWCTDTCPSTVTVSDSLVGPTPRSTEVAQRP
ncbi:MAG: CSLREA domain-containing protein [Acidimicrobiales bacterium]